MVVLHTATREFTLEPDGITFKLGFSPPQPAGHWLQTGYLSACEREHLSPTVRMVSHMMLSKA